MLSLLSWVFWMATKLVLSLRYRVRVHGVEKLEGLKGGTLILPNHPGYIDPPLVLMALWPSLRPRPLLYEGNFDNPVLAPLMKLLQAVRVPNLERPSAKGRERTRQAIQEVIGGLNRGENHILWPSGYLWRDGQERLGGAQAVTEILLAAPDANLVLVRTRGVWGSMFSFAQTGTRPNFLGCLQAGAGLLLANLLFFMPRRSIEITVERIDRSRLPGLRREQLNPWLEQWFNAPGQETPTWVRYHFLFGKRTHSFPPVGGAGGADLARVAPETQTEVVRIIERRLRRPLTDAEKQPGAPLHQLGLDSLERMELTLEMEQRFGFASEQSPATLGELWVMAQGLARTGPVKLAPAAWFRSPADAYLPEIRGDTIAAAFVARALAGPGTVAAADDLAGVVSYGRLLAGSLALAKRVEALPGRYVGLLLPASVACDSAFLALHLAGKVPVMLNWTTGPRNLAHAVELTGLTHVVTSNAFVDRLDEKAVQAVKDAGASYVCLEEVRAGIGTRELLRTLVTVRRLPDRVERRVPQTDPEDRAVILFTSGSEKAPKAVPLTHVNLLSDQRAVLSVLGLTSHDSVLGFLPPFHSFGLSVTTLMPLLSGVRVVHLPDPTAAAALARKIAAYQPTLMVGAPTFVSYALNRAQPAQLRSLRIISVGAERCPSSLWQRCGEAAPQAQLLEGYGATECSPVISVNPPNGARPGTVGPPVPNVEVCVVKVTDPDTLTLGEDLPIGQVGMLLVSGPTVFPGYLAASDKPAPFVERRGKRWYVTGDLATLDAEGYIRLEGRLKRFLKAGGEMISLEALEAPFAALYPPKSAEEGPRVAVEGVELEGRRHIVLFCARPIHLDVDQANEVLRQAGLTGVNRLDEVRQIDAIPVLGVKTDYKELRRSLSEQPGR